MGDFRHHRHHDTISAEVSLMLGGVVLLRQTEGDAIKTWVDARISVDPADATNEIDDPHTYTVTLEIDDGSGFVPATVDSVTIEVSPTTIMTSNTCASGTVAGACSLSIVSGSTGIFTIIASAVVSVLGEQILVSTDDSDRNSGPATKTFVDARISINPLEAYNRVGDPHTFTVTVEADDGSGSFMPVLGETVTPTLTGVGGVGSITGGSCQASGTDGSGRCTVIIESAVTGQSILNASVTLMVGGVELTRQTGSGALNSADAVKTWVDAKISIDPVDATNEVGDPHTFTVTVLTDDGAGGFLPADVGVVDITVSPSTTIVDNSCAAGTTDGVCSVTIVSTATGEFNITASAEVTVLGQPILVTTDSSGQNSGPATKTFVDAKIQLSADEANVVGYPHTFTVTVAKDTGSGVFSPATGETVTPTLIGVGGVGSITSGTCQSSSTDAFGQCAVVIGSSVTGKSTLHATVTVSVDGVELVRETGSGAPNSADAVKTWVYAYIGMENPESIREVDDQATYIINVSADDGSGSGPAPVTGQTVTITVPPGVTIVANTCETGTVDGTCTVTVTTADPGTYTITATADVVVLGETVSVTTEGTAIFVDVRISVAPDGVNQVGAEHTFTLLVEQHDGSGWSLVASAVPSYTLTNSPGATGAMTSETCSTGTDASGECSVTIVSTTTGTTTIQGEVSLTVEGVDLYRQTEPDAVKIWVNARISIDPDSATNAVGHPHTFTVTVLADNGSGLGFTDADSVLITVSPDATLTNDTCVAGTTGGTCSVTVNSGTPGGFTITATANMEIMGQPIQLSTDGAGGNSGPATKTFVDARISVEPDGVNPINAPHTFTITVEQHDGSDWGPVVGATPIYSLDNVGANGAMTSENCSDGTNASGQCSVTIVSADTGTTTIHAETSITVADIALSRQTETGAVKTWVNAGISINPGSATNAVGDAHTFTITVSADPSGGHPNFGAITAAVTPIPDLQNDSTCGSPEPVDAYTRSCTITINSSAAGVFTASAAAEVKIKSVTFVLATSDQGGFPDATKTYVDARISVAPDGVNPVGAEHTFTILVEQHDGSVWGPVVGATPIYSLDNVGANGAMTTEDCSPGTDASGECSVTIVSSTTGTTTIHAEVSLIVDGEALSRQTDPDAVKTWVSAGISIDPDSATNAVGDAHTFTVTVSADPSGGLPNFGAITAAVNPVPNSQYDSTCGSPEPVDTYTRSCTITINSSAPGVFTASASAEVEIGGVIFVLATGGQSGFPNATKTYVDARISVAPDGVNPVGAEHTFTILVEQHDGSVWGPVVGATPIYSLDNVEANGAMTTEDCSSGTDAFGECRVTIVSSTTGTTTIHTEMSLIVDGAARSRQTDPDAVKTWVSTVISVSITADRSQICQGPDTTVIYTIKVWNGGSIDLSNVTVSHDILGDITTQFIVANDGSSTLASAEAVEFTVTEEISNATTNQATAQGVYSELELRVENTAQVTVTDVVCEISGHKYQDLLNDGTFLNDTPLSGWVINLYDAHGIRVATKTTGEYGGYSFRSTDTSYALSEGDYVVGEEMQPNWQQTSPGGAGTLAATVNPLTSPVAGDLDFYNYLPVDTAVARMTGGGSIFDAADNRVTHGFQLRCDMSEPNRLQVNWGKGNSFHLTSLTYAECYETSEGYLFHGQGTGRCNGKNEVRFDFTFSDHGEPGSLDLVTLKILCGDWTNSITTDNDNGVLSHKPLDRGNHRVHDWDPHGSTAGEIEPVLGTASADGTTVTYTYEETNNGDSDVDGPTPTDPTCTPLVRGEDNPGNNDNVWQPGETWVYTCSTTVVAGSSGSDATEGGVY